MQARDPDGSARKPSSAAVISMTLFVVWASPPLYSSTIPSSQQTSAAHPPGPGLRWHAPSVQTSTSPCAACGRWPGSELGRRRGLTAIRGIQPTSEPGKAWEITGSNSARLRGLEENWIPVLRSLERKPALADAHGFGRPAAVDRACGCGGGAGRRWRVLPRPPFRATARLAVPAARGGGGEDI